MLFSGLQRWSTLVLCSSHRASSLLTMLLKCVGVLSSERVLRWPNGALSVIRSWLVDRVAQGNKLTSPSVRQLRRKLGFLALKILLLGVVGGRGFGILQIGFVFS